MRRWRETLVALLAALLLATVAQAQPLPGTADGEGWLAWLDEGEEHPARVLGQLAALDPQGRSEAWRRGWWRTRGMVAASGQDTAQQAEAVRTLQQWRGPQSAVARADAQLVEALQAEREGRIRDLMPSVDGAVQAYAQACAAPGGPACDLPSWWRLLRLRALWAECKGLWVEARTAHRQAVEVAQRSADPLLQAWSLSALAVSEQVLGDGAVANEHLQRAQQLAQRLERPELAARLAINRARLEDLRGDHSAALLALDGALEALRDSPRARLQALVQTNRADLLGRAGRLREAVAAAEAAWPVLQRFGDRRIEPVLQFNLGLAHLAQGQLRQGRGELSAAVQAFEGAGAQGALREALRQGGDALSAAGDTATALSWFHRERTLADEQDAANRAAALGELRQDHDRNAEQQEVERLRNENLLAQARLDSQTWQRRLQWLIGGSLLLMAAMLGVLMQRTRMGTQRLQGQSRRLRWLGGRDPLTGLANRRQLMAAVQAVADGPAGFEGAVLMLDVDHFKRINDQHGHRAGDEVLATVGRRLRQALGGQGQLCRWGGEEFLVVLPPLDGPAIDGLVVRLMAAVGDAPVATPEAALAVRLSVGVAAFPLPGEPAPVRWDTALARADLALYTAKAQGRDQAVRVTAVLAEDAGARGCLAGDFAEARQRGLVRWVTLARQSGVAENVSTKLA